MDQCLKILAEIAARHLFLETLETRHSDSLDFREMFVGSIKDALEAACKAGRQSRKTASPKRQSKSKSKSGQVVDLPRKNQGKSTT